jgi:ligand-binding sensor domain-containing protein/signal transduction histidine kinase
MRRHALWLPLVLIGASLTLRAERLPIEIYTTANGLAHNEINRIVKDSRGFLWFCTAEGLSRFDGYTFTNFGTGEGLPHSSVNDFLETRAGAYWIATGGGLVRFDPKGRPGRRMSHQERPDANPAMFALIDNDDRNAQPKAVTVLREGRDGTIWAGTDNGLSRLEHAHGRAYLRTVPLPLPNDSVEQRQILDLLEDDRGSLWIAGPGGLYRRSPDGSTARYTRANGLPDEYLDSLLQDHEGHLWAAGRLGGFFRFSPDGPHGAPVVNLTFSKKDGLSTDWVFQLFETTDRRFWAATARGIVEFFPAGDGQGHRFRSYARRNGLSYFDVTALTEDLSGNLWLGTKAVGAMKLARDGFRTFGAQDGIELISAVYEDSAGDVCFRGSVLGDARTSAFEGAKLELLDPNEPVLHVRLGCFDGQRFDWFKPAVIADVGWVGAHVTLHSRSGEWWIGTGEGLFRFAAADHLAALKMSRPLAIYTLKDGLAAPQVFKLFEDTRGNIWVSTISSSTNGLARWEPVSGRFRDLSRLPGLSPLRTDLARSFAEDSSGSVWIGFTAGLARYREGSARFFTARDGLPPGAIQNIYADHTGRLWLASARSGLVRVDDVASDRPKFTIYTTNEGLSSNNTDVIVEDLYGHIYAGGGHGLDRLDPTTGRVKHFTTADGLAPGLFHAAFRDRAGTLWFGMSTGLARLSPVPDRLPDAPPVLISGLRVRGIGQLVSALGEQQMVLPDFAPAQNQMEIDFVGLGFATGEVLRYQYRLDGADADWSVLGARRTVTYANLAPGRYRFRVRAVNSDGVASAQPAAITFAILSPVWQRWWFLALAALALGFAIHAVYRYRLARLLELANMRTRIATDLHDDIGANLTRIALLSEVAQRTPDAAPLASIGRIARESVSSMSDIVWAINPRRESLFDLIARMRQHAEEIFTMRDIELRFNAPAANDGLRLGIDVRRDVLLIFKEVVNNAARHSGCSMVAIDLRVKHSQLEMIVADNGHGFDTSIESQGQGLASLYRRARKLKGTLAIDAGGGMGTTVTLRIPT